MEQSVTDSTKVSEADGSIYLQQSHQTFHYNTDYFHKDDAFITVGMVNQTDVQAVTTCAHQTAVIGATILNYEVQVPGNQTRVVKFPNAVAFRRRKDG